MTKIIFIFLTLSFNCMAASIDVVISGQLYDGIHRLQNGEFIATTASEGQVIRFDAQGNQSVLLNNGSYFLGVTEDNSGNLYASDAVASRIFRISPNGQAEIFSTSIQGPGNLTQAPNGNIYVGSLNNGNGGIYELDDNGNAVLLISESVAEDPLASTFDAEGNYYFSNSSTAEIFRLTPNGEVTLYASLPITAPGFKLGHFVIIDGYLYAPGFPDNRIYRVSPNGDIEIVVGRGAAGEAGEFQLSGPAGITAGNQPGEIYVTNYNGRTINRIQLDVIDNSPISNPSGLSGLWYDPTLNGEGYNIIYTSSGLLIYFYGYNDQGERLWLISDLYNGELNFGQTINLSLLELTGGTFAVPASPIDNTSVWGSLKITINDCATGKIELDGVDGMKTSEIEKLANVSGVECE